MPKTSDFDIAGEKQEIPGADTGDLLERIIDENDLLPVFFLQQGANVQRAVARVVLLEPVSGLPAGSGWGTGSLISPSLFLTNNHVIPNKDFAAKVRMQFNYQLGPSGLDEPTQSYWPDLNGTFHTNVGLDYTVIRLKKGLPSPQAAVAPRHAGDTWGWISLNDSPGYHARQHFNIIQHPQGRRKEIALQDNEISSLFTNVVRYQGDTEPGSSGSPVFDNLWRLVALHHAGGDRDPQTFKWLNNEGIRVDRIVEDLRDAFSSNPGIIEELGI
jgi:V8-like Glu-specific endopeptidase